MLKHFAMLVFMFGMLFTVVGGISTLIGPIAAFGIAIEDKSYTVGTVFAAVGVVFLIGALVTGTGLLMLTWVDSIL